METFNMSSVEKEKPIKEGVLSEDEARDLANMMSTKLGSYYYEDKDNINGEDYSGTKRYVPGKGVYEITSEDYKNALQEIEEMQRLASDETKTQEFVFRAKKILLDGGKNLAFLMGVLNACAGGGVAFADEKAIPKLRQFLNENFPKITDAKTKLKELIEKGKLFEEGQKN